MTRASRFATKLGLASAAYVLLWLHVIPVPLVPQETTDTVLAALPWWVLIAVGSHLMYELGKGLYFFHDTPKAYEELLVVRILLPPPPLIFLLCVVFVFLFLIYLCRSHFYALWTFPCCFWDEFPAMPFSVLSCPRPCPCP